MRVDVVWDSQGPPADDVYKADASPGDSYLNDGPPLYEASAQSIMFEMLFVPCLPSNDGTVVPPPIDDTGVNSIILANVRMQGLY
ncbi:MAG: hypothetical protein Q9181_006808 [Wetmoreana brouardii]